MLSQIVILRMYIDSLSVKLRTLELDELMKKLVSLIIISPILLTRLPGLNRKALFYNRLIFSDLVNSIPHVVTIHGYDDMLDNDDCLNVELARYHDYLHLNASGIRYLSSCIKDTILGDKRRNKHRGRKSMTKGDNTHPT